MTVEEFLNSENDLQPVRQMAYGPVVGEHHDAAMFGPDRNPLGATDVAASPDTGLGQGDLIMAADGSLHTVADWSYLHPDQPTHGTIEFRDRQDQGRGFIKKVNSVDDFLGVSSKTAEPQSNGKISSVDDFLGIGKQPTAPTPTPQELSTLAAPEGSPRYQSDLEARIKREHPEQFAPLPPEEYVRQNIMAPTPQVPYDVRGERPVGIPYPIEEKPEDKFAQALGFKQFGFTDEEAHSIAGPAARFATTLSGHPEAAEELTDIGVKQLQQLGTPENVALALATGGEGALATAAQIAFAGQGGAGFYDAAKSFVYAKTPEEKTQALADMGVNATMIVPIVHASFRKVKIPSRAEPPPVSDLIRQQPSEPTLAEQITQPQAPPEVPPEVAPPAPEAAVPAGAEYTVENQIKHPRGGMRPGITVFDGPVDEPHGIIEAERKRTGELEVFNVQVKPELQGTGRGVGLYEKLIAEAGDSPVISDTSVSESAARAWEGLARRGYTIEKNPTAQLTEAVPGARNWTTTDGSPVFRVTKSAPVPAAVPPPPIGTPLKPVPLHGPEGTTAADVAAAQQQVAPEAPAAAAPGDVPVIPPEDVRYAGGEPPAPPVAEAGKAGTGEGGISIKNEYTDTKRQELGFPEAVQEARRDFGTVWNEAEATDRADPGAKGRLVEAINEGRVKAIDDHGDALLLREQVRAQGEHNDAVNAVNNALTDADRTAAKARLEVARDSLQAVYDADRKAGRSTAQGLNARKMLAAEDYSLTQMEARARAANNGERLSEPRLKAIEAMHARIDELSKKVDELERARQSRGGVAREARTEAKLAAASGKRLVDYTGEAAKKARERINRQLHGLGAKPAPPTLLADYAIVGADHLARGLTKFSDWSAQMIKEFGDRVKPYLKDLWNRATSIHNENAKRFQTQQERNLAAAKTRMARETVGVTAKIQRGDFTKPQRQPLALDPAAFKMKANLQRLKNEFERGVAKDAYRNMGKADKFWQHFVGVERAMKLSSPAVFEKLGLAAAVREVLAPAEAAGGWAVSKVFPRLAKGTRYGADLRTITRAEIKAKAALFTQGMKDSWENIKGKETELEAISDKYGRQPDFWYNRIGKIHAAVKAPIKRAEFVRSLETRMDAAAKAGEDINHPAVMDRLATESALDANRAIFQQNTAVSKVFAMLDRTHPAAGRTARFLFPVVKIPVNLFKELVTYNVGAPAAAIKIGHAYWKGIETLEPAAREAIIRQLVKGSVGGAAILWGYYNSDRVHDFFKKMPPLFQHTPVAMAIHEGSIIKQLEEQGGGTKYRPTEARKEATYMAKSDIPFMYTITGAVDALNATDPDGWKKYLYGMIQSTTVPQISSWAAKELDKPTPFSLTEKPAFRPPTNIVEAIKQGIPGLREDVPIYHPKGHRK